MSLKGKYFNTYFLVDRGALNNNYVNDEIANLLRNVGMSPQPVNGRKVCRVLNGKYSIIENSFELSLVFLNEISNQSDFLNISALLVTSY